MENTGKNFLDLNSVLSKIEFESEKLKKGEIADLVNSAKQIIDSDDFEPNNDDDGFAHYKNSLNRTLGAIISIDQKYEDVLEEMINILEKLVYEKNAAGSKTLDSVIQNAKPELLSCRNSFNLFLRSIIKFESNQDLAKKLTKCLDHLTSHFKIQPSNQQNFISEDSIFFLNSEELISRAFSKFQNKKQTETANLLKDIAQKCGLNHLNMVIITNKIPEEKIKKSELRKITQEIAKNFNQFASSADSNEIGASSSYIGLNIEAPSTPPQTPQKRIPKKPFMEKIENTKKSDLEPKNIFSSTPGLVAKSFEESRLGIVKRIPKPI